MSPSLAEQVLEDVAASPQDQPRTFDRADGLPEVLLIGDLAGRLRTSVRTIERKLRAGTFPIPELPRLDDRHRWSSVVVNQWLSQVDHPVARLVARPRKRVG